MHDELAQEEKLSTTKNNLELLLHDIYGNYAEQMHGRSHRPSLVDSD